MRASLFVGEQELLEDDPGLNWEPVKFDEGCDVSRSGVCEDSGS